MASKRKSRRRMILLPKGEAAKAEVDRAAQLYAAHSACESEIQQTR